MNFMFSLFVMSLFFCCYSLIFGSFLKIFSMFEVDRSGVFRFQSISSTMQTAGRGFYWKEASSLQSGMIWKDPEQCLSLCLFRLSEV